MTRNYQEIQYNKPPEKSMLSPSLHEPLLALPSPLAMPPHDAMTIEELQAIADHENPCRVRVSNPNATIMRLQAILITLLPAAIHRCSSKFCHSFLRWPLCRASLAVMASPFSSRLNCVLC
ncbi:hypothetical protein GOP47_0015606 [Adiantum capillus-veneris]|uniref:Uncharacterized protein n=1 Tax=Adiantum capillus-veneris TaxID=13818 RepID=A0A9D4UK35_ADICA|nr:hypothetical protein GOP47_0015606 [Adiantum capillus-veneris]